MLSSPSPSSSSAPMNGNSSITLSSIESLLAPLRYVDRTRVARDVLDLIRNSNSLQIKVQPFGQRSAGREAGGGRRPQRGDGLASSNSFSLCCFAFALLLQCIPTVLRTLCCR